MKCDAQNRKEKEKNNEKVKCTQLTISTIRCSYRMRKKAEQHNNDKKPNKLIFSFVNFVLQVIRLTGDI